MILLNTNYKFIRKINTGKFANVFECQNDKNEKVALKTIKKNIIENLFLRNYFDSEINILKLCDHPNIIKLENHIPSQHIYVLV